MKRKEFLALGLLPFLSLSKNIVEKSNPEELATTLYVRAKSGDVYRIKRDCWEKVDCEPGVPKDPNIYVDKSGNRRFPHGL